MLVKSFEVRPFNDFEQGGGVLMCLFLALMNRNVDLGQPNLIVLKYRESIRNTQTTLSLVIILYLWNVDTKIKHSSSSKYVNTVNTFNSTS